MYYIYQHVDLTTREPLYIGKGSGGRAWFVGFAYSPSRTEEHNEWAESLLSVGKTPDEFVEILHKGLTNEQALTLETELIRKYRPVFNKSIRHKCLRVTPAIYKEALLRRQEGFSYSQIADSVGLSTMTIYRALNNRTISLEEALRRAEFAI